MLRGKMNPPNPPILCQIVPFHTKFYLILFHFRRGQWEVRGGQIKFTPSFVYSIFSFPYLRSYIKDGISILYPSSETRLVLARKHCKFSTEFMKSFVFQRVDSEIAKLLHQLRKK